MNNHNPTIKEVLNDASKQVNLSRNLLTQLWRTILFDLSINNRTIEPMVKRYLVDPNSGIRDTTKDRNNHRGNLMKELGSPDITWRVFMKALRVLEVTQFKITIQLTRKSRATGELVTTEHSVASRNEITYEPVYEDYSRAKIIDVTTPNPNELVVDALPSVTLETEGENGSQIEVPEVPKL